MNIKESKGLLTWLKTHPHKAMLLLFVILIPLFLLMLFSISYSIKGKSFYFDVVDEEIQYLRQSDLASQKTLDEYFETIEFDLVSVSGLTNENDEKITYGKFEFERNYIPANYYKDAKFTFRYIMTANWFDEQSDVLINNSNKFTINFPHNLPKHKHLILKINKPILYVEITVERNTSPGNENVPSQDKKVLYYKFDLKNVEYINVNE